MTMREIATIQFFDSESGGEAIAIVRAGREQIALCVSLEKDGDVEVFLRIEDCESLVKALEQAILATKANN
jgi:hypothetical protein